MHLKAGPTRSASLPSCIDVTFRDILEEFTVDGLTGRDGVEAAQDDRIDTLAELDGVAIAAPEADIIRAFVEGVRQRLTFPVQPDEKVRPQGDPR